MAKMHSVGVQFTQKTRRALEKAAEAAFRSLSGMVKKIVRDWLLEKGYFAAQFMEEPLPVR